MGKSKVDMRQSQKNKCHALIHSAAVAAGAAGTIPIPLSDAIPIGTAQITMIVALGKVFDITISQSAAQCVAGVGLASYAGRTVFTSVVKLVPGIGPFVSGVTAAAITEMLGWVVADDFFRISTGQRPENIQNLDRAVGIYDKYDKKIKPSLYKGRSK